MSSPTFVVAGPLDQRTGGYLYDARIVAGLREEGREVRVVELPGAWPEPGPDAVERFRTELAECPDGSVVVVDGLVGGAAPGPIEAAAERLRIVALVHHPLADEGDRPASEVAELEAKEARTLRAAAAVVVTSEFTRGRVVGLGADPDRVAVVEPGTDRPTSSPPPAPAPDEVVTLLCLGSVVPRKDQAGLVRALVALHEEEPELAWRCEMVGSLERSPRYAARVREAVAESPIAERVRFTGEVADEALERIWERADVLVSASRYEGYGMALTEAMVRGLPVIAVSGGAVGRTVPEEVGLLVSADDPDELRNAIRRVVAEPEVRAEFGGRSLQHGMNLPTWSGQAAAFGRALEELTHE